MVAPKEPLKAKETPVKNTSDNEAPREIDIAMQTDAFLYESDSNLESPEPITLLTPSPNKNGKAPEPNALNLPVYEDQGLSPTTMEAAKTWDNEELSLSQDPPLITMQTESPTPSPPNHTLSLLTAAAAKLLVDEALADSLELELRANSSSDAHRTPGGKEGHPTTTESSDWELDTAPRRVRPHDTLDSAPPPTDNGLQEPLRLLVHDHYNYVALERAQSHKWFLERCLRERVTPKSLQINNGGCQAMMKHTSKVDEDFQCITEQAETQYVESLLFHYINLCCICEEKIVDTLHKLGNIEQNTSLRMALVSNRNKAASIRDKMDETKRNKLQKLIKMTKGKARKGKLTAKVHQNTNTDMGNTPNTEGIKNTNNKNRIENQTLTPDPNTDVERNSLGGGNDGTTPQSTSERTKPSRSAYKNKKRKERAKKAKEQSRKTEGTTQRPMDTNTQTEERTQGTPHRKHPEERRDQHARTTLFHTETGQTPHHPEMNARPNTTQDFRYRERFIVKPCPPKNTNGSGNTGNEKMNYRQPPHPIHQELTPTQVSNPRNWRFTPTPGAHTTSWELTTAQTAYTAQHPHHTHAPPQLYTNTQGHATTLTNHNTRQQPIQPLMQITFPHTGPMTTHTRNPTHPQTTAHNTHHWPQQTLKQPQPAYPHTQYAHQTEWQRRSQ